MNLSRKAHDSESLCIFEFDYDSGPVVRHLNQNITVAGSGLGIWLCKPGCLVAQQTKQNAIIEIFFLFFCSRCVSYADRVPQIISKDLLNFFQKCIAEFFQFFTVISGYIAEPFPDFLYKKVFNFPVWNSQAVFSAFCTSLMRQISGSKKYAPQVFNILINLIICEIDLRGLFGKGNFNVRISPDLHR